MHGNLILENFFIIYGNFKKLHNKKTYMKMIIKLEIKSYIVEDKIGFNNGIFRTTKSKVKIKQTNIK